MRDSRPFVGRERELEHMLAIAEEVRSGAFLKRISLHGPWGIGKSRLMDELGLKLEAAGFWVLASRAEPAVGPYAPWTPLIVSLLGKVSRGVSKELAPVLSSIGAPSRHGELPELEPRAARLRLFRAVATLLEEACPSKGLVIFLDDWHQADEESAALLSYLTRTVVQTPLLLVVGSLLPENDAQSDDSLGLSPLPLGDVNRLAKGFLGGFKSPTGGRLSQLTGGNPALVSAVASRLVGGALLDVIAPVGVSSVLSLGPMLQAHLAGCCVAARAVALSAAVAGPAAPLTLLQRLSDLEDGPFSQALEELSGAGLLDTQEATYTLIIPPELVVQAASDGDIRGCHARALATYRLAVQLGDSVASARLAFHATEARSFEAAVYYGLNAAREALKLFALSAAERFLAQVKESLANVQDPANDKQWDYLCLQGDLYRYQGRATDAEPCYRQALKLAQMPAKRQELLIGLGITLGMLGRLEETEATYQEALALSHEAQARAQTALARLYVRQGRTSEAVALCQTVLTLPDVPALYRGEALGLVGLLFTTGQPAKSAEGLNYLAEARQLAEAMGDRLALNNACMLEGNARLALGQFSEARMCFERNSLLCQELGLKDEALCATLNLAQVAYEEGRYVESWNRAQGGVSESSNAGNGVYEAFGKIFLGLSGAHLGHLQEAESSLSEGLELAFDLKLEHLSFQVLLAQLESCLFLGRLGKAEELGLALEAKQRTARIAEFEGPFWLLMGRLYELSGEVATATPYYKQADLWAEETGNGAVQASAHLGLGALALLVGQSALAQERAQSALFLATQAGVALPRLRSLLLLGRLAMRNGDFNLCDEHLHTAAELAGNLASPHWQALVWQAQSYLASHDGQALNHKAQTHLHFYLRQLPPRARQEFLNWPERQEILLGRSQGPSLCDEWLISTVKRCLS